MKMPPFLCLAPEDYFLDIISLPPLKRELLQGIVENTIPALHPLPLEDLVWSWEPLDQVSRKALVIIAEKTKFEKLKEQEFRLTISYFLIPQAVKQKFKTCIFIHKESAEVFSFEEGVLSNRVILKTLSGLQIKKYQEDPAVWVCCPEGHNFETSCKTFGLGRFAILNDLLDAKNISIIFEQKILNFWQKFLENSRLQLVVLASVLLFSVLCCELLLFLVGNKINVIEQRAISQISSPQALKALENQKKQLDKDWLKISSTPDTLQFFSDLAFAWDQSNQIVTCSMKNSSFHIQAIGPSGVKALLALEPNRRFENLRLETIIPNEGKEIFSLAGDYHD